MFSFWFFTIVIIVSAESVCIFNPYNLCVYICYYVAVSVDKTERDWKEKGQKRSAYCDFPTHGERVFNQLETRAFISPRVWIPQFPVQQVVQNQNMVWISQFSWSFKIHSLLLKKEHKNKEYVQPNTTCFRLILVLLVFQFFGSSCIRKVYHTQIC